MGMRETLYSRVLKAHMDDERNAAVDKLVIAILIYSSVVSILSSQARTTRARCFETLRRARGAPREGGPRTVPMPMLFQCTGVHSPLALSAEFESWVLVYSTPSEGR